ncbi:MAG: TIGR02757 family protein [Thermonema sp.]|uniref:TIGR02757 family protein n=1 Tax=Thermonema sp. TaxID=2231181 RepID=UPI0021DBD78D|nr:TIGR02757 family protein [Thermonema sp.]GIV39672.1 MAG: TIGR02757 family protein [Thermonema sp.]
MSAILQLKELLDKKAAWYNHPDFIETDPISIPHAFAKKQDKEIAGLFAAVLAWGNRKTIINKCRELMQRMDNSPYEFIKHHQESDLKQLLGFKHRTFQETDLLYFVAFLHHHYQQHDSLEQAFLPDDPAALQSQDVGPHLDSFHRYFFSLPYAPRRTRKHIPTPARQSACKRLAMYLRWMVRRDQQGVDFGLWQKIKPAQLICPCDVHVVRTSLRLGLLQKEQVNWRAAVSLTAQLRLLDPNDPVRYDFALFGMGLESRYGS